MSTITETVSTEAIFACPATPPIKPSLAYQSGVQHLSESEQRRFAHCIERKVVGPMPVDDFLDTFFPLSPSSSNTKTQPKNADVDDSKIEFTSIPKSPKREEEMYDGLCSNLNKIVDKLGFFFCDTSKNVERPGEPGTVKPDIGLFRAEDENAGNLYNFKAKHSGKPSYVARMGLVYLFIEVKKCADQDFFTDPPNCPNLPPGYKFAVDTWSEEEDQLNRTSALGQIAHYAHVIQSRQFRTCVFSLTISGGTARIMRWDRSGVLVTRSFDYVTNPGTLIDFIRRFINANKDQQGFDSTAIAVDSKEDRNSFREAIESHVELQLGLDDETPEDRWGAEVGRHYDPGVLTRLAIAGRRFWVCRPLWVSRAIVGRCTVAYWGVDCDSKEVVLVKDVWRTKVDGVEMEGDILERLGKNKVSRIPSLVCHGDVTFGKTLQTTHTDRFAAEPWVRSLHRGRQRSLQKVTPRTHYRLVTDNAGYPLSSFKGSRELLRATFHASTALMDAIEKAETLHRDVGLPNIVLYRPVKGAERDGCLVDWELAVKSGSKETRNHAFIGTPAFMSIDAMKSRNHVHTLEDDLESLIYVVLYAALRWLPVGSSADHLEWWFRNFFGAPNSDGRGGGGDHKNSNAQYRDYTENLETAKSPQVMQWLNDAMDLHYKDKLPNPAWKGGKALKEMWEKCLEGELPDDDRCINPVPQIRIAKRDTFDATHTAGTSLTSLYAQPKSFKPASIPAKRSQDEGDAELPIASEPRKRLRSGRLV